MTSAHNATNTKAKKSSSSRAVGAFQDPRSRRRYWVIAALLSVAAVLFTAGLLAYDNPMEFGTEGFWLIAQRRLDAVIAMAIVAVCQGIATVAFQTVTNNRIITPSILGFESLYTLIHTSTVFFFGASGLIAAYNLGMFVFQIVVMVLLSFLLYSWLLTRSSRNMHAMLLVGIVLGGGLGSVSTFMQRTLSPSEFDVLTARMFGSMNNADSSYYPIAIPIVIVVVGILLARSSTLNVMSLGAETSTNLGVNFKRNSILTLMLVSVLMAISTSMVGPMTFLGFLVATLAYQCAETYDHRYIFPMAALLGYVVLTGAYFVLNHVFYAQGVVSIIIELVGGITFLIVVLRKGRL
ncbi:iron chelate uptake ABC transporter family permease subunit [Corynebacterium pilosum]|uniref:ABC-type cobalamin/Fe3+-siderophore transport system, permease n=1 Tax=Corynebacterium pilosum TaxID=35756 RepID=A0A376CN05_9CORY|nr:iron chelate uptake ABC transporter family permease subunit [Corynebacterium pilosum]STC69906.1 ABC-type cobalamin/Fe3+-siderophore transport system, permease [Corynebacterium pilosum]